jgi:NitT/TauT family transport system substrate-binding protein
MTAPRRSVIAAGLALPSLALGQGTTRVRFTMDWAFQAPQTFGLIARERGFFRELGLDVTIDRGQGSGGVPVALAGGTHDMGYADLSPTLRFVAENPSRDVVAIAMLHDRSPLCVITRADGPIRTPRDLEGKRLAAPDFDAARQLFPAFAAAAGFDASKVSFVSVTPALREPIFIRREADGITASVQTSAMALVGLGMAQAQQRQFMYNDAGLDLYGGALLTTGAYMRRNPDVVKRMVAALMRGFVAQIADPAAAMETLKRAEPLTDAALELERHHLMMQRMVLSDHVRANGLSAVLPARLEKSLDVVKTAFSLTSTLTAAQIYTPEFLPPAEQLRLPASAN